MQGRFPFQLTGNFVKNASIAATKTIVVQEGDETKGIYVYSRRKSRTFQNN